MPFTIFAHRFDPDGAFAVLREIYPKLKLKTEGYGWNATLAFGGGFFSKKQKISITFDPNYCSPPEWDNRMMGMRNFVGPCDLPDDLPPKASD